MKGKKSNRQIVINSILAIVAPTVIAWFAIQLSWRNITDTTAEFDNECVYKFEDIDNNVTYMTNGVQRRPNVIIAEGDEQDYKVYFNNKGVMTFRTQGGVEPEYRVNTYELCGPLTLFYL